MSRTPIRRRFLRKDGIKASTPSAAGNKPKEAAGSRLHSLKSPLRRLTNSVFHFSLLFAASFRNRLHKKDGPRSCMNTNATLTINQPCGLERLSLKRWISTKACPPSTRPLPEFVHHIQEIQQADVITPKLQPSVQRLHL